jgi:solute:Na+ symporter, SSS family
MKGLLIASFMAAYMSTISTQLNWGASYLVNDIYLRFVNPEASEKGGWRLRGSRPSG